MNLNLDVILKQNDILKTSLLLFSVRALLLGLTGIRNHPNTEVFFELLRKLDDLLLTFNILYSFLGILSGCMLYI